MKLGRRFGALTAGVSLAAAGMIATSSVAFADDPYYPQTVAFSGATTQGLTFDASGTMYVADTARRSIDRVNPDGSLSPVVSSGLQGASGILADGNRGLYIADTNNSLFKYWDATTGTVSTLSSAVATPHGLTWGPDGDVYIADSINNRIAKWDPTTSTMSAAAYNLSYPSDVAVAPNGDIYAADTSNHRIAYFPASNPYVPQTLVSNVAYPLAVTLDAAGNLFFADLSNQIVEERNATTGVVSTIYHTTNNIYGLRFGPGGGLYMTDSSQILRLNAYSAPGAPRTVSATAGNGTVGLSFDAPASNGGSAVTSYEVSTDGGGSWTTPDLSGSGPYSATLPGLDNGTSYAVQVRAINAIGTGPAATANAVTPDVAPAAPDNLVATAGANSIALSFTAPPANGGSVITGYEYSIDGGTNFLPLNADDSVSPLTATITGLTAGQSYTVRVRARNAGGPGADGQFIPATPTGVPSAPQALQPTGGDKSISLLFTAPSDGSGLPVLKYQTSKDDGATWQDATTTGDAFLTTVVGGLTNGTSYAIQLRAVNADGPGATAIADAVTPKGAPGAPSILGAQAGNGSIQLTFTDPTNDGGSAVTYYEVSTDGGDSWNVLVPFQNGPHVANVTGLTNGSSYSLLLRAGNQIGAGVPATADAATPSTTPDAPTNLTAVSGDALARLTFSPPSNNGGAGISGYEYTLNGGDTWNPLNVDQLSANIMSGIVQQYTATVAGLTNGQQYTLAIRARNVQGGGSPSNSVALSPVAPQSGAVAITGPASRVVAVGSTVVIAGTAPAGTTVKVYFHQRGQGGYLLRRTLTATSGGTFSTSYVAGDDYRYYAQVGSNLSTTVLTQSAPTVAGPLNQVVKKNSTVTLHGLGVAGSTVQVHFHKAGTAADDYSIVRDVVVAADGTWTRSYLASVDYRFFVSSTTNGTVTSTYLVQAR